MVTTIVKLEFNHHSFGNDDPWNVDPTVILLMSAIFAVMVSPFSFIDGDIYKFLILPSSFWSQRYLRLWSHHCPFFNGDICKLLILPSSFWCRQSLQLWSHYRPFFMVIFVDSLILQPPFWFRRYLQLWSPHYPLVNGNLCKIVDLTIILLMSEFFAVMISPLSFYRWRSL